MQRFVPYLFLFILSLACSQRTKTFEEIEQIGKLGTPKKIEYYKHIDGHAFLLRENPEFVITNESELKSAFSEIMSADNSELHKGAGWDKLKIYFADTILVLNTNQKNVGTKASGAYFKLPQDNFIQKHLERSKIRNF